MPQAFLGAPIEPLTDLNADIGFLCNPHVRRAAKVQRKKLYVAIILLRMA